MVSAMLEPIGVITPTDILRLLAIDDPTCFWQGVHIPRRHPPTIG
jgi:hypothetical protein